MRLPDIEVVAAEVHNAWMITKMAQGITTHKDIDGEELMVPYHELTEKAKAHDRNTVFAVYVAINALAVGNAR